MKQEKITMKVTDTAFLNKNASPDGEFQARFVIVHPGREQEADSIMNAFQSAGGHGVRIRDGVVALGEEKLKQRIDQLKEIPGQEFNVGELTRGLLKVQELESRRNEPQVTVAGVKAKSTLTA